MVLTGGGLKEGGTSWTSVSSQIGAFFFCCSCVRVAFTIQKSFAKQEKEKSSSNSSRCAWPSRGPSQRGGWEEHAHSHFSWCVRKISAMTQRTRDLRWRRFRVVSGAYFSTWRNQRQRQERIDEGGFGCLARSRCKSARFEFETRGET